MSDARTVIARVSYNRDRADTADDAYAVADRIISALTAARLAVVPVPEGDAAEAVENVMLRYDADMKLGDNADACRDDLVALIAAEREACEARHLDQLKGILADVDFAIRDHADGEATVQSGRTRLGIIRDTVTAAIRAGGRQNG